MHAEVLAELEVLEVTQTHALVVAPGILQTATLFLRTDGGLPTISVPEAVATTVYYASARETHEFGLQVGQHLGKVLTQTMSFVSILRHQRAHMDQLKAAEEAFRAREEEKKERERAEMARAVEKAAQAKPEPQIPEPDPQPKLHILRLEFQITKDQALALRGFLDEQKISYRKI